MPVLELAALLPVMGWFLSDVRWHQSRVWVWFRTKFTTPPLTDEPDFFTSLCFQTSSQFSRDWTWACVDVVSLPPDSLWWGVLTVFVRSPKRLLEWPVCRQGDDITRSLFPVLLASHKWKNSPFQATIASSPLPLQTARFALMVEGISNGPFFQSPRTPQWISCSLSCATRLWFPGKYTEAEVRALKAVSRS